MSACFCNRFLDRLAMRVRTFLLATLVIALSLGVGPERAAAQSPLPVALSATAAPAGGNYGAFSIDGLNSFLPVVSETGRVYFYTTLTGGSSTAGLFVGPSGALQTVALQGSPAPAGGNFTNSFSDLRQNGAGQVAFSCSLAGGAAAQGLYFGLPGTLQTVALSGTPAPGGAGTYSDGFSSPLLTDSGRLLFSVNLTGGASTRGLFTGTIGSIQAVALQGSPAPAGGNYTGIFRSALNTNGQVAYYAEMTGGSASNGMFFGTPGSLQTVALSGLPAPAGGNYSFLGFPALNNAGQMAFLSFLTGGASTSGIYSGLPGALQTVALNGTPAPAGGNFSSLSSAVVLNGSGQVAFLADLTGGSSTSGIFAGTSGSLQAVVLQGMAAPGGGDFSTFPVPPQINGSGRVAFVATLTGGGINTSNDRGLYVGSAGSLTKIIRKGDQIDVDPGPGSDLRTVAGIGFRGEAFNPPTGGQDGRGLAWTDSGFLVYTLTFTDGSSGVFVSMIPVPEPALAGLAVVITLAAVGFMKFREARQWSLEPGC
jgi:hypothetical protein